VASAAAISQPGTDGQSGADVAAAIPHVGTLSFDSCELTLEELASTANGAEGIAVNDEEGGIGCHDITLAVPDFLGQ
jgi:hypothetical protein